MSLNLSSNKIEMAVVSLMLQYPEEIIPRLAYEGINSDHFFNVETKYLHGLLTEKRRKGEDIELISLTDQIERQGHLERIGGVSKIQEVYMYSSTKAYISGHFEDLRKYLARRLAIEASERLQEATQGGNVNQLADTAKEAYEKLSEALSVNSKIKDSEKSCKEFISKICEDRESGDMPGLSTGLHALDSETGGLRDRELWVLAAKTSGGKSVLALQFVVSALRQNKKCAVFSLEMGAQEIVARIISCMRMVDFGDIMNPKRMNSHQMSKLKSCVHELVERELWVCDEAGQTVESITSQCIQLNDKHGLDLVIVDYAQLVSVVSSQGQARHEQIAQITKDLKQLAKKMNCPVVTASQLNDDGRLRESRAIGHDADVVAMIQDDGITLDKNRNGQRGKNLPLIMEGKFQRFTEQSAIRRINTN